MINTKAMFIINSIIKEEKNKFLLFFLSSAINLDIAVGIPNWPSPINNEKVGRIIIYNPKTSLPSILPITIFINIPSIFVAKPPANNIIVDLINLSFINKIYVKKASIIMKVWYH